MIQKRGVFPLGVIKKLGKKKKKLCFRENSFRHENKKLLLFNKYYSLLNKEQKKNTSEYMNTFVF